jgi:hypothetical protein
MRCRCLFRTSRALREPSDQPAATVDIGTEARAVDPAVVASVKASKTRRRDSGVRYHEHPRVAFVVHSFNRVSNVDHLAGRLAELGDHEVIICEDGSLDGSHERWMSYLQRPNDFLIHSNDLHEIRILDRAIRFTPAEIVCVVQDDDRIPCGTDWLDDALALFCVVSEARHSRRLYGVSQFPP